MSSYDESGGTFNGSNLLDGGGNGIFNGSNFLDDLGINGSSSSGNSSGNSSYSNATAEEESCHVEQLLIYSPVTQVLFSLCYAAIFLLGAGGNALVFAAVARSRQMRASVTNLFILNLAASDVVMCLFAVPFTPLQSFTGRWAFGEVLCKLFPFSQGVSVYISTLTLTIIAVDRYVIIIHPFRARMQVKTCLVLIMLIDLTAMAFTAPYAFHVGLVDVGTAEGNGSESRMLCYETWEGARRTVYGVFTNLTQFVLPFLTVIACYAAIIRRLRERASAGARPGAPARSAASRRREEQERARAARTNRMLIYMVAVFGACWFPLNTINFVADLGVFPMHCWAHYHFVFFVAHVMAMSSTCYNPFLYGWHNESFRQEFVRMLPFLRGVCGTSPQVRANMDGITTAPDGATVGGVTMNNGNGFSRYAAAAESCEPNVAMSMNSLAAAAARSPDGPPPEEMGIPDVVVENCGGASCSVIPVLERERERVVKGDDKVELPGRASGESMERCAQNP